MATEIRIIVSDNLHQAMAKITKIQKGPHKFCHIEKIDFEKVETHRPQQVTIDPQLEEVTAESPIGMLSLETKTINALRKAHTGVRTKEGKVNFTNIVRKTDMDMKTVGELLDITEDDLREYFDIGPKRIEQIKLALKNCNPEFALKQSQDSLPLT